MADENNDKKKAKDRHNCCVPQCHNVTTEGIHMHQVPRDEATRQKWAVAIKTGKTLGDKMTVCSNHFLPTDYIISTGTGKKRRLKPGSVPSQNLPKRSHDKVLTSPLKRKKQQRQDRASKRLSRFSSAGDTSLSGDGDDCTCSDDNCDLSNTSNTASDVTGTPVIQESDEKKMIDAGIQVNPPEEPETSIVSNIISCDRRLNSATGIHSVKLLDSLALACDKIAPESSLKKFSLCTRDRIVLTMMKIKLNISYSALAAIFDLGNSQTCANYFYDTIIVLSKVLNCMIFWPSKEDILKNMPKSNLSLQGQFWMPMKSVEKPKCIKCRIRLYSQYKKNFTAKIMMVCSPSGLITLCAGAFGGRASDRVVTKFTKVYEKCDPTDALMVDKGPPFQRNKKYSKSESVQCAKIARARVHVERVIQRVREFGLLCGKIPWNVIPYINDLVIIASALVNLSNPIMALDKY
ncbi:LOW QUALITY PROTEIN: DNA transposase [Frankliniella fusca]|uniref:DNA transposase n=1 Tax=Frankliniella fusca TaxID=407009 RepID=A0AAE1LKZ4_9NEOP|nr:LOW QUALITY PROTEIN: DNA transposase [Frankliniella fusca]